MSEKILLIDGHSILNRAFYGLPDLTNSGRRTPETNLEYSSDSNSYSSILSLNPRMASSDCPIHCSQSIFIENEISDIDGNYAFKHDKLVTKHV